MPPLKVDLQANLGTEGCTAVVPAKAAALVASKAELEVDYDHDITRLYEAITDENWTAAIEAVRAKPAEARTWVVRHHPDGSIMWRFLPLHSACARQPPAGLVSALLSAYRPAASICDDQGLYPLHYAAGNQASSAVIKSLILNYPDATSKADPTGMLPLHYLAKWGPSDKLCLDVLLLTHQKAALHKTEDGETPLELALDGEYEEDLKEAVITTLRTLTGESETDVLELEAEAEQEDDIVSDIQSKPLVRDSVDGTRAAASPKVRTPAAASPKVHEAKTLARAAMEGSRLEDLQQIYNLEKEVKALKKELKNSAAAHQQHFAKEKADIDYKVERLEDQVATLEAINENLTSERAKKDEFFRYIEGRLAEKDYEMISLQRTSAAASVENAELKAKYNALKASSDANAARLETLQRSTAALLEQHETIAAAVAKRDALFKAATARRQKKMQELINMEVELTKEHVADEREGDGSCLNGAIKRQMQEMTTIWTTVEDAIADAVVVDAPRDLHQC